MSDEEESVVQPEGEVEEAIVEEADETMAAFRDWVTAENSEIARKQDVLHSMYPQGKTRSDIDIVGTEIADGMFEPFDESVESQIVAALMHADQIGFAESPDVVKSAELESDNLALYDHGTAVLTVDDGISQQRVEDEIASRSTSNSVADVVMHEMVHSEHSRQLEEVARNRESIDGFKDFYEQVLRNPDFDRLKYRIREDLSEYAADSATEFVAEAGVIKLKGERLGEKLERLYRTLEGPEI